jgi:hypothetical protein
MPTETKPKPKVDKPLDYIEFANKGEVPINAFKLLGASSKRNDSSKIGYFGTGLKYALAVLLREGIPFKVYAGEKEVKISTRKTKFLDQEINVITVNGEKTSITVEAGINWEPWFAIREIYSNNLDEGGTMKPFQSMKPEAGTTKIYVGIDEKVQQFTENWAQYFSNTRTVLFENPHYKILQKANKDFLTVFRRGICTYQNRKTSLFDYDVVRLGINESRVAEHDYEARQRCAEALACCTNAEVLTEFMNCDVEKYAEKDSDWWTYIFDEFNCEYRISDTWLEVFKDKRIVPTEYGGFYGMTENSVALPERLCKKLYERFGDKLQIMGATKEAYIILDKKPTTIVEPAMKLLEKVGFGYPMEKVRWAKFKDEGVLGLADGGLVLLSEKLDSIAYSNDILEVLFEEVAHTKSGKSDNTRGFQDYIIKLACALITALPERKKETV